MGTGTGTGGKAVCAAHFPISTLRRGTQADSWSSLAGLPGLLASPRLEQELVSATEGTPGAVFWPPHVLTLVHTYVCMCACTTHTQRPLIWFLLPTTQTLLKVILISQMRKTEAQKLND